MTIRLVLQWLAGLVSDEQQVVGAVTDGRALIKVGFHQNCYPSGKAERFFSASRTISISVLGTMIPRDRGGDHLL